MWMAALTVSTSANTLPVMRQLELPTSSHSAFAWRMCRMTLRRNSKIAGAVEFDAGRFPRALGILPTHPLDEVVLDERVVRPHAADAFDSDVADGVAANDVRVPGLRITRAVPVLATDVQAYAIGPFDGVALDDPVVATTGRNEAVLRRREGVAGMLKGDALDPDVSQTLLAGRESLFSGSDLDHGRCGISSGHPDVHDRALVFDPEPAFWSAADLLHDRFGRACATASGAWR